MASYVDLYHSFFNYVQPFGWDTMTALVRNDCYEDECEWLLRWLTAGEDLNILEHDVTRFVVDFGVVTQELADIYLDVTPNNESPPSLDTGDLVMCSYSLPSGENSLQEGGDVLLPFGFANAPPMFQNMLCTLRENTSSP